MNIIVAITILLASSAVSTTAQALSPIIQELKGGKKPAKGEFTITNNSIQPMAVVLETKSLAFGADRPAFVALAPETLVRLSEYSFKIPPKASHTVWFEVRCTDCGVAIFSSMVIGRTVQGLQVALHLPEVVYVCSDKAKGCRDRLLKSK